MKDKKGQTPDWVPKNAGDAFAVSIKKGIELDKTSRIKKTPTHKKRAQLGVNEYIEGVLKADKTILARTITLIESNSSGHYEKAREVLKGLLPYTGNSLRIGITGVPGAGKSTLIETLGCYLIKQGNKVAVLAVDPTSSITKGSILGDKTRMEKLSREQDSFIRPSPSGGTLGGVTRKSRETILICEAAGFDVILIETMGVGQSEITVRSMVDFFLLVMISGAGDELQGIKKGVIEIADAIVVNKADSKNKDLANAAKIEYSLALKYLAHATKGWETNAYTCSALTGEGIHEIWNVIKNFEKITKKSGFFYERRKKQTLEWMFSMIENYLNENFYENLEVQNQITIIKNQVLDGILLPTTAAENLLKTFYLSKK